MQEEASVSNKIVVQTLKLMSEILDNHNGRLRFDTWNMNGLIVFKESSKLILNILSSGMLATCEAKIVNKVHNIIMTMMCQCLSGGYINFAICDFYQDNQYTELTSTIVNSILA